MTWRPASGMQSKGKTLWRCWNEANSTGFKELQTKSGRTWFCWSYEAASRKCDRLNALSQLAVDHIDGDSRNNDPANLRLVTISENSKSRSWGR